MTGLLRNASTALTRLTGLVFLLQAHPSAHVVSSSIGSSDACKSPANGQPVRMPRGQSRCQDSCPREAVAYLAAYAAHQPFAWTEPLPANIVQGPHSELALP